jgi:hypothetical protein
VATLSILEHYWTTLSTFASTFNLRKEEVWRILYKREGSDQERYQREMAMSSRQSTKTFRAGPIQA